MERLSPSYSKSKIFSVSELNRETKDLLSSHFSSIQVEGEISNLSTPSSGHIYFSLKDKKAQIRCAMFKSQLRRLSFKPANGQQLIISAQVSLYEARGDYQLIVDKMQQAGDGDLQIAFDQLKAKLLKEGLFDSNLKQTLPLIPKQIAVISSATGAAVHDILSVLKRRFPAIPIIIYPTSVQGENAKNEICHALEIANSDNLVDVIILARGGGSIEDLWAFNEECVARAIVKSKIPVVSGIGHEVDFTIADFVADLRAPTPSAAAENVVPNHQDWLSTFQAIQLQLQQQVVRKMSQFKQSTRWLDKRLQQQHPGQQYQRHAQNLDQLEIRMLRAINSKIQQHKTLLNLQNNSLQQHNPAIKISRYQEQQHYLIKRLNIAIRHKMEALHRKLFSNIQTLNAVSPLATLERGYSIVSNLDTSEIITSSQQLSIDTCIKTRLAHGHIISQVKDIIHEK